MTETMTEDSVWYLARDGKQHGPLSHIEMTKLVELGHLRQTDLVWRPGFADWRPATTVFEFQPPAPPPPPVAAAPPVAAKPEPAPAPVVAAPRPQPSFANLSAKVEPAPAAAEKFDFGLNKASPAEPMSAGPNAAVRDPQPMSFDTGAFRPSQASGSQFGTATTAPEPAPEPFRMEPMYDDAAPAKKGRGVAVAVGLLLVIGGVSAAGYTFRNTLKTMLQGAGSPPAGELPVVQAPPAGTSGAPVAATETATAPTSGDATPAPAAIAPPEAVPPQPAPVVAAVEPQPAAPQALPGVPVTVASDPIDTALQSSPFWSYAKAEFPQWYADRLRDVGTMKAANEPDTAIDRKLVEQIVVLRRQNASKALAASPERLKDIAEAFVANLGAMQTQSVDTCYEFIEKGEMTPAAAALVQKPAEGAALHTQMRAVLAAVVEGQKNPVARSAPQPEDYNLLAAELGTIGWSQADIQLFADPKALAAAPRDRVCKMVKDWFSAHLAVKDEPARERLLHETLRLVIAG